jgi:hypothetical protein
MGKVKNNSDVRRVIEVLKAARDVERQLAEENNGPIANTTRHIGRGAAMDYAIDLLLDLDYLDKQHDWFFGGRT